jgi:hypothetical protein
MKFNKINKLLMLVAIAIAGITGCKKSDFNINKNPNQATDSTVSYDVILPSALHATGAAVGTNWGWLQNWMGYWARSGTYAPSIIEETYQITTGFQNGVWNSLYDNLYDYDVMQRKATVAQADFYAGIARIMKAHDFGLLVDVYNNVPYTAALQGNNNTTPKYDKGADIYLDLLRQIDTGISLIKGANPDLNKNISDNDIMFGARIGTSFADEQTLWAKFGNTMKLRLLVHLMNGVNTTTTASGFDIPGEIASIEAEGSGFLGAGEDATVNPGYREDKPNPYFNSYKADETGAQTANNVYYTANAYAVGDNSYYGYYNYDGDPRISRLYQAGSSGLVGVKYGLPSSTANASGKVASIGPGLVNSFTQDQWVLTAGESYFLQAEAQQRGFLTGSAEESLRQGVIENMRFLGVSNPEDAADTYIGNNASYPDVDINATGGGMYTILSQKWFAFNGIAPFEAWTDYRRTDFVLGADPGVQYDPGPPISVAPQNTETHIPVRLLYPQNEYNYNPTNVAAEGTINPFTSHIFWDLN